MKGAISSRYREDLQIGSSFASSSLGSSPPSPRLASRFVRRLADRFTGPASRRNSQSDSSELDLISPSSSELVPTASWNAGGGADEYAAFLGGFACFAASPIPLAAQPSESDLLHNRSRVPPRPRPPRTTSLPEIGRDPAHLPQPQHMAHPTASYASHHPSPRINTGACSTAPSQGTPIQGGADRNVDRPSGIATARRASDSSHPRTLLRRLTTSSISSLHSPSRWHEGPNREQGHPVVAVAATEDDDDDDVEEESVQGPGGGAPVLSSRFSDWSTAPSSRTPSPALSCGCRWTWWGSSESLHATTTTSSVPPPQVHCADHAAPPSGSPPQQQQVSRWSKRCTAPGDATSCRSGGPSMGRRSR